VRAPLVVAAACSVQLHFAVLVSKFSLLLSSKFNFFCTKETDCDGNFIVSMFTSPWAKVKQRRRRRRLNSAFLISFWLLKALADSERVFGSRYTAI